MTKHNPANERIKRGYFQYLKEAQGRNEATIDGVAKSLARFEESTKAKDFKRFHREQAKAFKDRLAAALNARTGEKLSKTTMLSTLRDLRAFFIWLARERGFKSHISYSDADYFNLTDKDAAVARARREKRVPTLAQLYHVLASMPSETVLERRDRALLALAMLTGARANALASFRLGHVDLVSGYIDQDARTVRTKASKSFRTYFMPIGGEALAIFGAWHRELVSDQTRGPGHPLFPASEMGLSATGGFEAKGLSRKGWASSAPVRRICREAFERARIEYHNPHSFRATLVRHAMTLNLSPEGMKAWSQNLGHNDVLTTFTSYGQVPTHRQGELIRANSRRERPTAHSDDRALLEAIAARLSASSALPGTAGIG